MGSPFPWWAGVVVAFGLSGCLDPWFGEVDHDADGVAWADDCDDDNSTIHPGAPEICDGRDNDCDGSLSVDEQDADSDGWSPCDGDAGTCATDAGLTPLDGDLDGFSTCDGDCNDLDGSTHPGAAEDPSDGVDNDCDGVLAGDSLEDDSDGDGFSDLEGDCDDGDPGISPGLPEAACDGVDTDCDGHVDAGEQDGDADGYNPCQGDCDDTDNDVNPGSPEVECDGADTDCDGQRSDAETDADADGWTRGCPALNVEVTGANDCDDADPGVWPRAHDADRIEVCGNGVNDDCDGSSPDDFADVVLTHDFDVSGDGYLGPDQDDFITALQAGTYTADTNALELTSDEAGVQGRLFSAAPVTFPLGLALRVRLSLTLEPGAGGFAVVLAPADPFRDDPDAWGGSAEDWLGAPAGGLGDGLGWSGMARSDTLPQARSIAVTFRTGGADDWVSLEDGSTDRVLASQASDIDLDASDARSIDVQFTFEPDTSTFRAEVTVTDAGVASQAFHLASNDVGLGSSAWYVGVTAATPTLADVEGEGAVARSHFIDWVDIHCD